MYLDILQLAINKWNSYLQTSSSNQPSINLVTYTKMNNGCGVTTCGVSIERDDVILFRRSIECVDSPNIKSSDIVDGIAQELLETIIHQGFSRIIELQEEGTIDSPKTND